MNDEECYECCESQNVADDNGFFIWDEITNSTMRELYHYIHDAEMEQEKITLFINSVGGSYWDSVAVVDKILRSEVEITATADGLVASSAVSILIACSTRKMGKNAVLVLHRVSTGMPPGEYIIEEIEEAKVRLDLCNERLFKLLVERSNMPEDFWRKNITNNDFIISADEALEYGLIDRVLE